jgi:hypothetical protein
VKIDVGMLVGIEDGTDVGMEVGTENGADMSMEVGTDVGTKVGKDVGVLVGMLVGHWKVQRWAHNFFCKNDGIYRLFTRRTITTKRQ